MVLRTLAPMLRTVNGRSVSLPPKQKADVYNSPEFRTWRSMVVQRAGYRCEALDNGHRCRKAHPEHRVYADHIIELFDGGSLLDPNNGQCLCASHHELKTIAARIKRFKS
jgi:hypothetical protein